MLYHVGYSQHTQNMQMNKVIGENEKFVFYGKKHTDSLAHPIFCLFFDIVEGAFIDNIFNK